MIEITKRYKIDIDFNCICDDEIREKYFRIYENINKEKKICVNDITENEQIKYSFLGFYSFLIEIRNRYFHFLQGSWQENISSIEVLYPEHFFKPIIDPGINWVAIIIFEIISHNMNQNT